MDVVMDIWFKGWHSIDAKLLHPHSKPEWRDRWVSQIIPKHDIAVVEVDGEVLGFITVNPDTSELSQLFTRLAEQGRGVGTALINWAKNRLPGGIFLSTLQLNRHSRDFYEKHGFRETGASINELNGYPSVRYEWTGICIRLPSDLARSDR